MATMRVPTVGGIGAAAGVLVAFALAIAMAGSGLITLAPAVERPATAGATSETPAAQVLYPSVVPDRVEALIAQNLGAGAVSSPTMVADRAEWYLSRVSDAQRAEAERLVREAARGETVAPVTPSARYPTLVPDRLEAILED